MGEKQQQQQQPQQQQPQQQQRLITLQLTAVTGGCYLIPGTNISHPLELYPYPGITFLFSGRYPRRNKKNRDKEKKRTWL